MVADEAVQASLFSPLKMHLPSMPDLHLQVLCDSWIGLEAVGASEEIA